MTKINIKHIAKLAALPLTQDEEKKFEPQLEAILSHIEKLSEVHTSEIEETSQVTGLTDIHREDTPHPSFPQDVAISQAKTTHNGLFVVPVIIEEAIET